MGRILKVEDTHPNERPAKPQKHTYAYDANGNITYEYMQGNGAGKAKNETLYTYDVENCCLVVIDPILDHIQYDLREHGTNPMLVVVSVC